MWFLYATIGQLNQLWSMVVKSSEIGNLEVYSTKLVPLMNLWYPYEISPWFLMGFDPWNPHDLTPGTHHWWWNPHNFHGRYVTIPWIFPYSDMAREKKTWYSYGFPTFHLEIHHEIRHQRRLPHRGKQVTVPTRSSSMMKPASSTCQIPRSSCGFIPLI